MQRATLVLRTNPILPSRQLRWQDPIWSCKSLHLYSTMVVYSFTHRWRPSPSFTELNGGDISTVGKMTPYPVSADVFYESKASPPEILSNGAAAVVFS